jgi:hypothetical protein
MHPLVYKQWPAKDNILVKIRSRETDGWVGICAAINALVSVLLSYEIFSFIFNLRYCWFSYGACLVFGETNKWKAPELA